METGTSPPGESPGVWVVGSQNFNAVGMVPNAYLPG